MEGNVIELSSDSSAPPSPRAVHCVDPSEPDDLLSVSDVEGALGVTQPQRHVHCISDSEESVVAVTTEDGDNYSDQSRKGVAAKKRPRVQSSKLAGRRQGSDEERRRRDEERRKKEEVRRRKQQERDEKREKQMQERRMKAALAEASRMMQPGHCLKYFYAQLDSVLLTEVYGGEMLVALQGAEVQYKIEAMLVRRMISWTRLVPWKVGTQDQMSERNEDGAVQEREVLVVQPWSEVVQMVDSGTLCTHVHSIKAALPGKKLTLVIYGMDQYFRYQKARRNKEYRGRVLGTDKASSKGNAVQEPPLETAAVVSRQKLEEALAEVQLFAECCHRLVESPSALGALVAQFSKAIAEKPFKLEKQRKEQEHFSWFAVADSKDCVPVDAHGNGLLRLWKQQLCQFNLATLETAEAIASKYQSPQALIEAYNQCTSEQSAELLLQEIPIRRALGPLTSTRRVGPQLSKKVYRFFTAEDGEAPLSQE